MGVSVGESWFISSEGKQIGPLAAEDILARAMSGGFASGDLVWHPSLEGWATASEIFGKSGTTSGTKEVSESSQWLRVPEIRIRNFTYLVALFAVCAACFIMLVTAFLSDDSSLALPLLGVFSILGWWCYLECQGTRLHATSVTFPSRPPFWPHVLAYRMTTIPIDRVSSMEVFSQGQYMHGLVLGLSAGQARLIFDDMFFRDLALAAILARNPHLDGTPKSAG